MTAKPSKQRRQFGAELRKLRKDAGMSQAEAAERFGWSQSKVSKSELGTTLLPPEDVRAWAQKAGADQATSDRLVGLAVELKTEDSDWSADEGEFAERNIDIGDVERDSTGLHNFQPSAISGLLQTADYARRVMTLLDRDGEHDIGAAVAARADRQAILYDTSKRFEFVLTEGALRWRPGPPGLMLAQLDRLLSIGTLPNVTLGVLPFDREATELYLNGFTIFDHPDDPFVLVESYARERRFHDQKTLTRFREIFAELRGSALTGSEATDVIRRLMEDLRED